MLKFIVVTLALCAIAIGLNAGCKPAKELGLSNKDAEAKTLSAPSATNDATTLALIGKWARTDGDYVLEISAIQSDGNITAAYFNPNPIHISKALLMREVAGPKLFVELQDVGYPGCTYSLKFDPANQQLFGQYYQAAQQQTYDIVFAKLKE